MEKNPVKQWQKNHIIDKKRKFINNRGSRDPRNQAGEGPRILPVPASCSKQLRHIGPDFSIYHHFYK